MPNAPEAVLAELLNLDMQLEAAIRDADGQSKVMLAAALITLFLMFWDAHWGFVSIILLPAGFAARTSIGRMNGIRDRLRGRIREVEIVAGIEQHGISFLR